VVFVFVVGLWFWGNFCGRRGCAVSLFVWGRTLFGRGCFLFVGFLVCGFLVLYSFGCVCGWVY